MLVGGDDPVPGSGGVAGGDPAAVDPVVDGDGGHAELGGESGDGPLAGCQAGEHGGPPFLRGSDAVLADQGADLPCGEPVGPLGRPVSPGVEDAGDLAAVAPGSGEPGDAVQERGKVRELVQAGDRPDGLSAGLVPAGPGDGDVDELAVPATLTVMSSIRMRSSSLRSACVVDGAFQTRGRSPARAWIAVRSAAVRTAGCCSVNRWQSASSWRATSLFSGSASWYWRRARPAAQRARSIRCRHSLPSMARSSSAWAAAAMETSSAAGATASRTCRATQPSSGGPAMCWQLPPVP